MSELITCTVCKEARPPTDFRAEPRKRNGRRSNCRNCERDFAARWQKRTGQSAQWMRDHPEQWQRMQRKSQLKRRYGITLEDYEAMLASQGGACAICGSADTGTRSKDEYGFVVDHDHATGRVRGLLCMNCNVGIGNLGDSIERIEAALRYLSVGLRGGQPY